MEQDKIYEPKRDRKENINVTIKEIVAKMSKKNDMAVEQVRFILDDESVITFKPKRYETKTGELGGIKTVQETVSQYNVSDLLLDYPNIKKLDNEIKKNKVASIQCSFNMLSREDNDSEEIWASYFNSTDLKNIVFL